MNKSFCCIFTKINVFFLLNSFLIRNEAGESQSQKWKSTIIALVREVVSSVDPNVRKGDSLDVQPYVKLKIIPGKDRMFFLSDLILVHFNISYCNMFSITAHI